MAGPDRIAGTLQEDLLTLLCHSDEHGKIVASIVDPALFEGDYRVVAERAVDYWRRYGAAPKAHAADLVSDIIESKHDRRAATFRGIIVEMLRLSEAINARYAIDRLRSFVRMQKFQSAVLDTARRLQSQKELALPEVEEMWGELLRARDDAFAPGVTLNDTDRLLNYLRATSSEFDSGIAELDARGVAPYRGAAMLLIASTGLGKTWGLIHMARRALMLRKKVFFASLEMPEEEMQQRFYQAFFGASSRGLGRDDAAPRVPVFEKDMFNRLSGIDWEDVSPEFAFTSAHIEDELEAHRRPLEGKFKNIVIKSFPTRGLTIGMLRGYLDNLESATGFVPDMLVLDYIGIVKTDARDHRISLGRAFEDFKGLCDERSIAGVTAQQVSKEGARAKRAGQTNVAEDWSLIGTANICLSVSATSAEKRLGLARLFVEKARRARDRWGVILSQNFDTGQFAIDSALLDPRYEEILGASSEDIGPDDEA